MEKQQYRVMLTGGGSGGPTTPLLGLVETLEEVEEISCEFLFLGDRKSVV